MRTKLSMEACLTIVFFALCLGCSGEAAKESAGISRKHRIELVAWLLTAGNRFPHPDTKNDAGMPLYSWRLSVLPEFTSGGDDFEPDLNWNSDKKDVFRNQNHELFTSGHSKEPTIFLIVGDGTIFERTFVDAKSQVSPSTLIAIEGSIEGQAHWMEPGDISISNLDQSVMGCEGQESFWVIFANGDTVELKKDVPAEFIRQLATVSETSEGIRERVVSEYAVEQEKGRNMQSP